MKNFGQHDRLVGVSDARSHSSSDPESRHKISTVSITRLADDLDRLSTLLRQESRQERATVCHVPSAASKLYEARRRVDEILADLQPANGAAFDILVDLLSCSHTGTKVSVTSAIIASACAETTGFRWINQLDELGYIDLEKDKTDKRRRFVHLTQKGRQAAEMCVIAYTGILETQSPSAKTQDSD